MRRLNGTGRRNRLRALVEAEARPWPDFERAESHMIGVQTSIVRSEIEEGVRPQIEDLENEGGPPIRERDNERQS